MPCPVCNGFAAESDEFAACGCGSKKDSEEEAYAYAYNDGHVAGRKREPYKPTPDAKEIGDFRKVWKQRAESFGGEEEDFELKIKTIMNQKPHMNTTCMDCGTDGVKCYELDLFGTQFWLCNSCGYALVEADILTGLSAEWSEIDEAHALLRRKEKKARDLARKAARRNKQIRYQMGAEGMEMTPDIEGYPGLPVVPDSYGTNSALDSGQGVPVWYGSAEDEDLKNFLEQTAAKMAVDIDGEGSPRVCSECKIYGYWDNNPVCPMCRYPTLEEYKKAIGKTAETFEAYNPEQPRDSGGRWSKDEEETIEVGEIPYGPQITLRQLAETMMEQTGIPVFDLAYKLVQAMLASHPAGDTPMTREILLDTLEETGQMMQYIEDTDYDYGVQVMVDMLRQAGMEPPLEMEEQVHSRIKFEDEWTAESDPMTYQPSGLINCFFCERLFVYDPIHDTMTREEKKQYSDSGGRPKGKCEECYHGFLEHRAETFEASNPKMERLWVGDIGTTFYDWSIEQLRERARLTPPGHFIDEEEYLEYYDTTMDWPPMSWREWLISEMQADADDPDLSRWDFEKYDDETFEAPNDLPPWAKSESWSVKRQRERAFDLADNFKIDRKSIPKKWCKGCGNELELYGMQVWVDNEDENGMIPVDIDYDICQVCDGVDERFEAPNEPEVPDDYTYGETFGRNLALLAEGQDELSMFGSLEVGWQTDNHDLDEWLDDSDINEQAMQAAYDDFMTNYRSGKRGYEGNTDFDYEIEVSDPPHQYWTTLNVDVSYDFTPTGRNT
jgi:transposase-like protein